MKAFPQTYEVTGGFGLARMAMHLAALRADIDEVSNGGWLEYVTGEEQLSPSPRTSCIASPDSNPWSCRYYEIIDRITRGEQP